MITIQIANATWCWDESGNDADEKNLNFLSDYIESNGDRIRGKYLKQIHEFAYKKIKGKTILDHLEVVPEFSLWWMTLIAEKSFYKSKRIEDCLKLLALAEILQSEQPVSINVIGLRDNNIKDSIQVLCNHHSIKLIIESNKGITHAWTVPNLLVGLAWLGHYLFKRWKLIGKQGSEMLHGEKEVILFSYFIHLDPTECTKGKFYSHQWETLPNLIQSLGYKINWAHHFLFTKQTPNVTDGSKLIEQFNHNSPGHERHGFIDGYLTPSVIVSAIIIWLRLIKATLYLGKLDSVFVDKTSGVSFGPLIKNDWYVSTYGKVGIQNALWVVLLDKILNSAPEQKLGLYLYEGQGWEQALIHSWRKYGHGDLIGVQHATVRFWDLRYFNDSRTILDGAKLAMYQPQKIALNSQFIREAFLDMGYLEEKLIDVEALRYLDVSQKENKTGKQKDFELTSQANCRLLVVGDVLPEITNRMIRILSDAMLKTIDNFEIVIKAHPGSVILKSDFPDLKFTLITDPLPEVLHQFDLVLGANATAATLDAYLEQVPVIVFVPKGMLNMSPLRGVSNVSFVNDTSSLVKILLKWHNVTELNQRSFFWRDKKLSKWDLLLS